MKKVPLTAFENYLPQGTFPFVQHFLDLYSVKLKLVSERKTLLGTYFFDKPNKRHVITLNETLNKYAMLVVFLHEIAHLIVQTKGMMREKPHGKTWQNEFSQLLLMAIKQKFFPDDLGSVLMNSITRYKLRSCTNVELLNALRKYDKPKENIKLIQDLQLKEVFKLSDGRKFINHGKKVKRYYGQDMQTKRWYSFHPLQEVLNTD